MSRIIAFGCSHTYGMGLGDSFIEDDLLKPAISPSKFAWPALLAEKLGYECVNRSIPGGSNLEILYDILDYKFQEGDKVVVGWTTPLRDIVVYPEGKVRIASFLVDGKFDQTQLNEIVPNLFPGTEPAKVQETNTRYFQVHSDADMARRSWLHQYTAGSYLKSKNIDFYFASAWSWNKAKFDIESFINTDNFLHKLHNDGNLDYASDGMHMGPKAQAIFADEVFNSVDW